MENKEELKWIPFEHYQFERDWYNKREQELLKSWGLGWLIDFCAEPIKKEENNKGE